jgi:hypothetical protein
MRIEVALLGAARNDALESLNEDRPKGIRGQGTDEVFAEKNNEAVNTIKNLETRKPSNSRSLAQKVATTMQYTRPTNSNMREVTNT